MTRLSPAVLALLLASLPAAAAPRRLAALDSFRVGSAGVLCTAQNTPTDAALGGMFDRGYALVCRDAAAPVGRLYALRAGAGDPMPALAARRDAGTACKPPAATTIDGLGAVDHAACTTAGGRIAYSVYTQRRGATLYVAEGLAGYESALMLGLKSVVTDRPAAGEVQVATTSAGDPAAFARIQAGTLDPAQALAEGYLRNNSGSYAEASEFFATLIERDAGGGGPDRAAEFLANKGLQESNLGRFAEADALFARAAAAPSAGDPVVARLIRNFRAIHALNQGRPAAAVAALDSAAAPATSAATDRDALARGVIDARLAARLARQDATLGALSGADDRLTPAERAQILDAQALQLRGTALRQSGDGDGALRALAAAEGGLLAVRGGRIASLAGIRADIVAERAQIAEGRGDPGAAEASLNDAIRIVAAEYPGSPTLLVARARLAAFLGRHGRADRALALYKAVVTEAKDRPGAATAMTRLLQPYFALLTARAATDPAAVADLFLAAQVLVRPGVAQTQAVLARELSGGGDAAAGLFRQSLALSRDIARLDADIARIAAKPDRTAEDEAFLVDARARAAVFAGEQTAIQSQLGAFPRYRVVAAESMPLDDLRKLLGDGEAYYKLTVVGPAVYAILATRADARAWALAMTTEELGTAVGRLRDSISVVENGQQATYPFDVALSRRLYLALFGPVADRVAGIRHLVYEPDGPMLQLPANLLVAEQAGADAYAARVAKSQDAEFDFTGIAWLGRGRDISTAVSPRAFADIRGLAPSAAKEPYIGFGHNAAPPAAVVGVAATRGVTAGADCDWALSSWGRPISDAELIEARQLVGGRGELVTDAAFSDTAVMARDDLKNYSIVHFATHGLVTAPRPECPARPALLTSFGGAGSDGLLSFREIYDLKLDADVVILSACDTAGAATVAATREAGITTGGNYALDGLVRAFVGAGSRSVVASHWPLPDDFDATKHLIQDMFQQLPGTPIATALRLAETRLMDVPETSHPYYWSAFAVVGDGERPLIRKR